MEEKVMDKNYSMKTIHRTIKIIKSFSLTKPSLSMTELNEMTGISIPSLQRILSTLVYEGFLQRNEKTKKYQLGMELYFLGNLVQKNSNILNAAMEVMERIREETSESVSLNTLFQNKSQKCIAFLKSYHELVTEIHIGLVSPLHAGASAKVILAHMTEDEIRKYLESHPLEKFSESTIHDRDKLVDELKQIRQNGYAVSYGERVKGAFSVSVPIFSSIDHVEDSMSITIPIARMEEYDVNNLISILKGGSSEVTKKLLQRSDSLDF
ncbi:IclR family transcriptional regulator [Bacillus sp. 1P10SD]|uniref:IclR family transcriptional regulator n=1 Tax=Bacillus sp. 1P10SD TaxID=3132265 RepID=UPI0039A4E11A